LNDKHKASGGEASAWREAAAASSETEKAGREGREKGAHTYRGVVWSVGRSWREKQRQRAPRNA
jgi:hypothetical protein